MTRSRREFVLEAEARRILGVSAQASPDEVRAAFRSRLRLAHPDVVPGDTGAGRATASLVEAYALLRLLPPPSSTSAPPEPGVVTRRRRRGDVVCDGDSLLVTGPPDEVYRRLVEVAQGIGEITYLDPDARLLDTIVTTDQGIACSLLASLQGRAAGTEIFFTIEPLGGRTGPAVEPFVAELAALLTEAL
ncbi:MAG: J domain-containing protein [Actinomycetota bacterium]|nr:J domain-containing protein [Actinomycetota bacterium]